MAVDNQSMLKFEEIFEVVFVQTRHGHHIGVVVLLEQIRIMNKVFMSKSKRSFSSNVLRKERTNAAQCE